MSAKVTVIEVPPVTAPVALTALPLQAGNGLFSDAFQQGAFQGTAFQMSPVTNVQTAQAFPASITIIEVRP